jgi:hypothetical protein
MGSGIGKLVAALEKNGQLQNTLIFFMVGQRRLRLRRWGAMARRHVDKPTFGFGETAEHSLSSRPEADARRASGAWRTEIMPDRRHIYSYGRD